MVLPLLVAVPCFAVGGGLFAMFSLRVGFEPVLSGSMRPTFAPGALLVTRQIPTRQVHPGDVVLIIPPGSVAKYAHRVMTLSGPAAHPVVTTKGDANPEPDPWTAKLTSSRTTVVVGSIPWLGRLLVAGRADLLRVAMVFLAGLVACAWGTRVILGAPRRPRTVLC